MPFPRPQDQEVRRLIQISTMQQLKSATAEHHARTEAVMPSMEEMTTPEGYAEAVRLMHGFHALWEPAIWATPGMERLGLSRSLRGKLPLLEKDLEQLEVDPFEIDPVARPELELAEAVGALYVIEGATLGGRVILKQVRQQMPVDADNGAAYYTGYGDRTGEYWRDFGAIVERFASETGERSRVVEGGVRCFAAFERWVEQNRAAGLLNAAAVTS